MVGILIHCRLQIKKQVSFWGNSGATSLGVSRRSDEGLTLENSALQQLICILNSVD